MTIFAATRWATNADLIADVAALGYLKEDDEVLDPTYGRGLWWAKFRPKNLIHHDIRQDGVDFTALPYESGTFDAVAFDPPYVCTGGRTTSTIGDFNDRYGLSETPKRPAELMMMNEHGMTECWRVLRYNGHLITKGMDYISSGRLVPATMYTWEHATRNLGMTLVDSFMHVGNPRPQPSGRRQVHARRNISTLFVFQKKEPF